jgi:hypothetical protein
MSSSARSRGKAEERRIAVLFGTTRRGPTGVNASDLADDCPYSVECKNVSLAGIQGRWIDQAREHSAREGKPWVLVVCRKGSRRPTFAHFLELIHKEEGQA